MEPRSSSLESVSRLRRVSVPDGLSRDARFLTCRAVGLWYYSAMLKIANVCLSTAWGGLEMSALRWARNLEARGHQVHSIVPGGSRLSQEARDRGLRQITVPRMTRYFDLRAAVKIRAFLRRSAVDVIQTHTSKDIWMLYPALVGWEGPRLFYVSRILFRGVTKRDWFHRILYSKLAGVITLTETGKRCFVEGTGISPDKVRVIPNGFEPGAYALGDDVRAQARQELGIGDDHVAIGCTSRIDRKKGQYELIEAVRTAGRHFSNLRLVIVGEPTLGEGRPYMDFLKRKVGEYSMDETVVFTGFRDDIPRVLSALDVFALPTYEETFGNCLVEAMLAGLPCVGTDAGGVPEVLEGGRVGLLVEPRSVESLSRALETLIENRELRRDLGKRARESARRRYDLADVLTQIEDFYTGP
jgi:glycosyltransferase involved in cell wall biosynthesis